MMRPWWLLFLSGCSGSPPMMMLPPDMALPADVCVSDQAPVKLGQHFGIRATLNVNVKVPAECTGDSCILDKDAQASLLMLAEIAQSGSNAKIVVRPCHIQIPPLALKGQPMATQLTAADALVQTVKPVSAEATLAGTATCAAFSSTPIAILIGTRLVSPVSDALPKFTKGATPEVALCGSVASTSCDSASDNGCVCDQEGDAKTGATLVASGLPAFDDIDRVYVAMRTAVTLDGVVFPEGALSLHPGQRLRGTVQGLKMEQSPVGCRRTPSGGASSDCDLTVVDAVAKLNPLVTQSVNKKSTFVAMPVADGATCDTLTAEANTLFK